MIKLREYIKDVKDFPSKGIIFKDISPLLANGNALRETVDILCSYAKDADVIVGPDARGFIFGTPVASSLRKPFVMIRKSGKLPGEVISSKYDLEYGTSTLEIQKNAIKKGQKVVIIDDVLATGGTMKAIINLIESEGGIIDKILFVVELSNLKGRDKLNKEVISLLKY